MNRSIFRLRWTSSLLLAVLAIALVGAIWAAAVERLRLEYSLAISQSDIAARASSALYAENTARVIGQIDQLSHYLQSEIEASRDLRSVSRILAASQATVPELSLLLTVADANGDVVASTQPFQHVNLADRAHFKALRDASDDRLYIGAVVKGRVSQKYTLQISRRLSDPQGRFLGAVIVSIDPTVFVNLTQTALIGSHAEVLVLGNDGIVRAEMTGDRVVTMTNLDEHDLLQNAEGAPNLTFMRAAADDGVIRRWSMRAVANYPLFCFVGVLPADHLVDYQRHRTLYLATAFLASLFVVIIFAALIFEARALTRSREEAERARQDFRAAAEGGMNSFIIMKAVRDEHGQVVDFECRDLNRRAARALGFSREELIGKRMRRDFPSRTSRTAFEHCIDAFLQHRVHEDEELVNYGPEPQWLQRQIVPIADGIAISTRDITSARRGELAAQDAERRVRLITDNLPVLIAHVDRALHFTFVNRTHTTWFGIEAQELIGAHLAKLYGEHVLAELRPHIDAVLAGRSAAFERDIETMHSVRHVQVTAVPDIGRDQRVDGIYLLMNDITALKEAERRLWALAQFDALTGLPNRHQFNERLERVYAQARHHGRSFALMFLDLDHFKHVNDTLGHAGGDDVLREIGERLKSCVRGDDMVARLGGDEFVVILEAVHGAEEALFLARKIQHTLAAPMRTRGASALSVTSSIGVALLREEDANAGVLLARADEALYQAKAAGRDTCRYVA